MNKDNHKLLIKLGREQIDAMFQINEKTMIDDSEHIPRLEVLINSFKTVGLDKEGIDQLWEYAYTAYDRLCKEAEPDSTLEENKKLMRDFMIFK
jgi:hypothetical protein